LGWVQILRLRQSEPVLAEGLRMTRGGAESSRSEFGRRVERSRSSAQKISHEAL